MSSGDAEAHLPETIQLDLADVRDILNALDEAETLAIPGSYSWRTIRFAIRLLTHKVWPDLGRLLDDEKE